MGNRKAEEAKLLATLTDAGLSQSAAAEIAAIACSGHWPRARQLLYAQRTALVNQAHAAQENLYRIDFILQSWKGENT